MSEAAPWHPHDAEHQQTVDRQFELVTNEFYSGPNGPFFVLEWDVDIDTQELLKRQSTYGKAEKSKTTILNGTHLLMAIFDQVGLVEDSTRIQEYRDARNALISNTQNSWTEEDEHLFRVLDTIVRTHDSTVPLVKAAEETYQTEYWEDFPHKKGQNVEKITVLYDKTEEYENSGLLRTIRNLKQEGFNPNITLEADRIARIMISHEMEIDLED